MRTGKKRIEELDFLRGFAILAVILIHTVQNFTQIEGLNFLVIINIVIDVFSYFAVPVFIIISGIVLAYNYFYKINYIEYYKKRFIYIIPQYIFFSLFYAVFYYFISGRVITPQKIIYWILTGSASYHLYFFLLIIQIYLIYPYLIKTYQSYQNKGKIKSLILYSILLQLIFHSLILYIQSDTRSLILGRVIRDRIGQTFISYISYFVIGMYIGRNTEYIRLLMKKINIKILALLMVGSTMFTSILWIEGINIYGTFDKIPRMFFIPGVFFGLLQYIVTFVVLWRITEKIIVRKGLISKTLKSLGDMSFGIYLVHASIIVILANFLFLFDITYSDWVIYPIVFLLTTLLSVIFCKIVSHYRYGYYIIGYKEKYSGKN